MTEAKLFALPNAVQRIEHETFVKLVSFRYYALLARFLFKTHGTALFLRHRLNFHMLQACSSILQGKLCC